ncbi:MAG: right-handed parallel beta-helix repeat-containing protein [Planctomycetes bacterium]|nr:right-handed parallel beta-helix repeat-containing protein [Planctomycetota bacterium]
MNQKINTGEPSFSVKVFGARGDGKKDDTAAIQLAIDEASDAGGGGVWFPAGQYAVSTLRVPSYVGLFAEPTWSYHDFGGTELVLNDETSDCLVDLTGSYGARVCGLGLNGANLGDSVRGIYLNGEDHEQEDTVFVSDCRISHFTGDAIHFNHIWGFTVRDSMMIFNGGDGLNFSCWDGWIHDNIFNNNKGWGIRGRAWNGAITMVGNRIEWNDHGGVMSSSGGHYSINDNYIDRSGGPGIYLHGGEQVDREHGPRNGFAITGNVIHRSGAKIALDDELNCHIYLDFVAGVSVTGNVMDTGRNDSGEGQLSPARGIVYKGLRDAVIKDNTLYNGAVDTLLVDAGDNDETCVVKDNPGRRALPEDD